MVTVSADNPIRLLHITDLHFRSDPNLHQAPDYKLPPWELEELLTTRDRADTFIQTAAELFKSGPPDAIIVSGDIVDKGGTDRPSTGPDEFTRATGFLKDLATRLKVDFSKVLVVPGNHDIDWTTQGPERFSNYMRAVGEFTSPHHLKDNKLAPVTVSLTNGDFETEITLLVSPLLSGVRAPWGRDLRRSVTDQLDEEARADALTQDEFGLADIAVLGSDQRDFLASQRDRLPDGIKIAVLHHHLLPHPQIEFTAFETVVDAGAAIDSLIQGHFDLVLTGHKHRRRLQRIAVPAAGSIDHYSGPSLFIQGPDGEPPGFTVIDIFGPDNPHYAVFKYYDSNYQEPVRVVPVRRDKRLLSTITDVIGDLSDHDQTSILPLLTSFRDAAKLRDTVKYEGMPDLFSDVLQHPQEELAALAAGRWTLRPPKLAAQWEQFLDAAREWSTGGQRPAVHLASVNDLDYWEIAQEDEHSHAARYGKPIGRLLGEKFRILILDEQAFQVNGKAAQADRVIKHMIGEGYRVGVVRSGGAHDKQYDFGIIDNIVVWTFSESEGEVRGLNLFFDQRTIQQRKWQWEELVDRIRWESSGTDGFLDWVSRRRDHDRG